MDTIPGVTRTDISRDSICVVDGCALKVSVKKYQYCSKHYQAFHKYGDPNGNPNSVRGQRCSAPGCKRTRSSREGYCFMHRQRLHRTGTLEKRKSPPCSEPDCHRISAAKGLCQRHYDRARGTHRGSERRCSVEDCERKVKARGHCARHYGVLQRTRRLETARLVSEERAADQNGECLETGCTREVTNSGRCAIHHNRFRSRHRMERLCKGCGADLTGLPRGRRYCSDDCKSRCHGPECDRTVSGQGLCSSHLKQRNKGEELRAIGSREKRPVNSPCEWCDDLVGENSTSTYCSWACRNMARRHSNVDTRRTCAQCGATIDYLTPANGSSGRLTPVSKRLCDKCRHRSASLYMSAEQVRERDGDNCGICGLPVPADVLNPHPLAAEVDHVLPIARGGTHDPENLVLVHKTCNIAKGDKPAQWKRDPAEVAPLLAEWRANGVAMVRSGCSVDGCERRADSHGMCQKHRRRVTKYGTTELPSRPTACSTNDCGKPVRAQGLCTSHYSKFLGSRSTCSESECDKNSYTRGRCRPHYNQWRLNRPDRPVCAEPECTQPSDVGGLCAKHYSQTRRASKESNPQTDRDSEAAAGT